MTTRRVVGLVLMLLLAASSQAAAQQAAATVKLSDITVATQPDAVTVFVKTSAPAKYQAELIDSPARLVIDFEDTDYAWRKAPLNVTTSPLMQIRGSQYKKGVARVVVQLDRKVGYAIREDDGGLAIVIPTSRQAKAPQDTPASTAVAGTTDNRGESTEPKAPVKGPVAKPAPQVRVAQAPPRPAAPAPAPADPTAPAAQAAPVAPAAPPAPVLPAPAEGQRLISLDFKDADVVNLLRILAAESGRNIVIGDDVKGKMSISLRNVAWELALDTIMEARGLVKTERDNVIRIVSAEQLAKEREAKARVEEAKLKAEADVRTKVAEATLKEAEARGKQLAAEAAAAEAVARGPLKEETIRLSYADPEDLAKTLSGILGIPEGGSLPAAPPGIAPIPAPPFSNVFGPGAAPVPVAALSPSADVLAKGITIRAHKPTNSIFIRHYANDLERIKKLIRENLDIPLPQVKIEARLNEINRTDLFEIGVQWGGAGAKRDGSNILVGQGFAPFNRAGGTQVVRSVDIGQRGNDVETLDGFGGAQSRGTGVGSPLTNPLSPFGLAQLLPVSGLTGLPLGGNAVNLLPSNLPTAGISFGIIGTNFNLNLALQALENQTKSRSLSKPEIVTVENAKASIVLGSEIPYATVSSAGTQIQFKEAALRLDVTPTVVYEPNSISRIKMKLMVEDNSAGDLINLGGGALVPSINKRRTETEVLVKEGDTLVVGGITQRTDTETVRKVPVLGDIPVFGWLFKSKLTQTQPNRELVIFVTPSLVRRDAPRAALQNGTASR
jgi:type IV pilus secretin PilQ/predicted competence protein